MSVKDSCLIGLNKCDFPHKCCGFCPIRKTCKKDICYEEPSSCRFLDFEAEVMKYLPDKSHYVPVSKTKAIKKAESASESPKVMPIPAATQPVASENLDTVALNVSAENESTAKPNKTMDTIADTSLNTSQNSACLVNVSWENLF